ncbi:MAG: hypothetical protein K2K82_01480 [Muribaculaceae bacterium]|nr:hypothetical protein [Muribaculaceae bacterium]
MQETLFKCPACGAMRSAVDAVCPECGYEFHDVQASQTLEKLADKLEKYDAMIAAEDHLNDSSSIGFWTVILWIFFFPIMMIIFLIKRFAATTAELTGAKKLKAEAILNFPVPKSKNDLLDFSIFMENRIKPLNLFSALTKSGMNTQKWNKIWIEKAQSVEKSAQISLKGDSESLREVRKIAQTMSTIYDKNVKIQWITLGSAAALFIAFMIIANI